MNGKTYINGDELTALANSLKSKSESILNTYKGECSQAIQMSSECLQLSGLNTTEFFQALEKIYNQLNEKVASFADFLTNVVVAEYNAVSEAIISSFNNEFASQISSLLGISVTASLEIQTPPTLGGSPTDNGGSSSPAPTSGRSTTTTQSTGGPTATKSASATPKIVTDCSGIYKVVKGCSGQDVRIKVDEDKYKVVKGCSGQDVLVPTSQPKTSSSQKTTNTPSLADTHVKTQSEYMRPIFNCSGQLVDVPYWTKYTPNN